MGKSGVYLGICIVYSEMGSFDLDGYGKSYRYF